MVTEGNGLPVFESVIVPDISRVCAITTELSSSSNVKILIVLIAQLVFMVKKYAGTFFALPGKYPVLFTAFYTYPGTFFAFSSFPEPHSDVQFV
jgi:hypothetical protein